MITTSVEALADTAVYLMADVRWTDGTRITQATTDSIVCRSVDLDDTSTAISQPSVTVSTSVFDSLQTDSRWTVNSTGYNFGFILPGAAIPDARKTYLVTFDFIPNSGETVRHAWRITTEANYPWADPGPL